MKKVGQMMCMAMLSMMVLPLAVAGDAPQPDKDFNILTLHYDDSTDKKWMDTSSSNTVSSYMYDEVSLYGSVSFSFSLSPKLNRTLLLSDTDEWHIRIRVVLDGTNVEFENVDFGLLIGDDFEQHIYPERDGEYYYWNLHGPERIENGSRITFTATFDVQGLTVAEIYFFTDGQSYIQMPIVDVLNPEPVSIDPPQDSGPTNPPADEEPGETYNETTASINTQELPMVEIAIISSVVLVVVVVLFLRYRN